MRIFEFRIRTCGISGTPVPRTVIPGTIYLVTVIFLIFFFGCSDDSVTPVPEVKIDSLDVSQLGPFVPGLTMGDTGFNGHGPLVTLKAELGMRGTDSLICTVYMKAEETEADWSTAEGEWTELVYLAPEGWKITGVCTDPPFCHQQYIDYDDDLDWMFCSGFIFRSQGDTPGADINSGTEVSVEIRCLQVEIEHE